MLDHLDTGTLPAKAGNLTGLKALRLWLFLFLFVGLAETVVRLDQAHGFGSILGFSGTKLVQLAPVMLVTLLSVLAVIWLYRAPQKVLVIATSAMRFLRRLGFINLVLALLPPLGWLLLKLGGGITSLALWCSDAWLLGVYCLISGVLFAAGLRKQPAAFGIVLGFVVTGVIFWLVRFGMGITNYPFAMGWSEGSRFYYASLYAAKSLYGQVVPLSFLDPSRYLLQSIAFLIPGLPIWVHRLWEAVLWVGLTGLAAWALARRVLPRKSLWVWLLAGGIFIIWMQVSVYYFLMVCLLLVFLFYRADKPWRSLVWVLLASLWAGISRVNWFPVPAMLAIAIYVMETPFSKPFWRYWLPPAVTGLAGVLCAAAGQVGYALLSGNALSDYGGTFSAPMLWYRLLPSEAYGQGVLVMALIAGLPLLALWVWHLAAGASRLRFLRYGVLILFVLVLLAGGIVVSARIGGGADVHNLDACFVMLTLLAVYFSCRKVAFDKPEQGQPRYMPVGLLCLVMLVPLMQSIKAVQLPQKLNHAAAQQAIVALQALIDEHAEPGDEVLFLDKRYLLTFGEIDGVNLVADYEKVYVMEMAMYGRADYFEKFNDDLDNHRFAMIITEPLWKIIRDQDDAFAEENNAWVQWATMPLLQHYQSFYRMEAFGFEVLIPRD